MSYKVLDEFKETNPHLRQQVTTASIVGGVATNFKVDDGFKEVLSKVGDAHPNGSCRTRNQRYQTREDTCDCQET